MTGTELHNIAAASQNTENSADAVFQEEQNHLTSTYEAIEKIERNVLESMRKTAQEAEEDKRNMADELASNFASDGEKQETYIEYANMNSVIDSYNRTQRANAEKLTAVRILKPQPYFAKVVLQYKPGAAPKELYIGNAGLSDDSYRRLIVDWRSPVAEVYYNQADGKTSYEANGRTINVDLKLRRQFDITGSKLNACFDTTIAIQDELLLASLSRQRTSQMQAITTTIQKEQNVVIRHKDVPALLVNGIAEAAKRPSCCSASHTCSIKNVKASIRARCSSSRPIPYSVTISTMFFPIWGNATPTSSLGMNSPKEQSLPDAISSASTPHLKHYSLSIKQSIRLSFRIKTSAI